MVGGAINTLLFPVRRAEKAGNGVIGVVKEFKDGVVDVIRSGKDGIVDSIAKGRKYGQARLGDIADNVGSEARKRITNAPEYFEKKAIRVGEQARNLGKSTKDLIVSGGKATGNFLVGVGNEGKKLATGAGKVGQAALTKGGKALKQVGPKLRDTPAGVIDLHPRRSIENLFHDSIYYPSKTISDVTNKTAGALQTTLEKPLISFNIPSAKAA